MIDRFFSFAVLALALVSCNAREEPECVCPDAEEVTFLCDAETITKSSLGVSETKVNNINVYAYLNGDLAGKAYSEGQSLSLELEIGREYSIYAIANVGEFPPPEREEDISAARFSISRWSDIKTYGIPFVCVMEKPLLVQGGSAPVHLDFSRLVCRFDFKMEKDLKKSSFRLGSVRLCQAALDVAPFSSGSSAIRIGDGDVSSLSDVMLLESGGTASFYMLENCKGDLLPDNTDPWEKIPDNIEDNGCTYLEVQGIWMTEGASAPIKYRMYLGENNCSNFDVRRNEIACLTLILSDDGGIRSSWKVERGELTDNRELRFSDSSLTVVPDGSEYVTEVISSPSGVECYLEDSRGELSGLGISFDLKETFVSLRGNKAFPEDKSAMLFLKTWDGVLKDSLLVNLSRVYINAPSGIRMCPGMTGFRTLAPYPDQSATHWPVMYYSTNPEVVTVRHDDEEDEDYCIEFSAVSVGKAAIKARYGPASASIDISVSEPLHHFVFEGIDNYTFELVGGQSDIFYVGAYPVNSLLYPIDAYSNSNPKAVTICKSYDVRKAVAEYSGFEPDNGNICQGSYFRVDAVGPGSSEIYFRSPMSTHTEKIRFNVVPAYGRYLECDVVSDYLDDVHMGPSDDKSDFVYVTENTDELIFRFRPYNTGAFISSVSVTDFEKKKYHSGWSESDYYSFSRVYNNGNECMCKLEGSDCHVTLNVVFGSNNNSIDINVHFSDD